MNQFPANFWDERYAADSYVYGTAPNQFLASKAELLVPGQTALVPADGEGRNGVWLAEQGLEVTTLDMSAEGVAKSHRLAADRGVSLKAVHANAFEWGWPEAAFDIVVLVFFHVPSEQRPTLHRLAATALKPGGHLIIEAFTTAQLDYQAKNPKAGGPPDIDMLMSEQMLRSDFADLTTIFLEETETTLSEGQHHDGKASVVHGVFKKEV